MGVSARESVLRWTVPASAALHGLLFLLLIFQFSRPLATVPIGVELTYSDGGSAVKKTSEKKRTARAEPAQEKADLETKPAAKETQEQEAQNPGAAMGAKNGEIVSALERYKYELRLFLDSRKIYPETARRLSQTGTVVVRFKIAANGEIADVILEKPAGSEVLNKAALDLVKRAEKFKPLPQETKLQELKLSFPIEYIL
jgi:protein TonB